MVNMTVVQRAQQLLDEGLSLKEIAGADDIKKSVRTLGYWKQKGYLTTRDRPSKGKKPTRVLLPGFPLYEDAPYWLCDFMLFYDRYKKSELYIKPWYPRDIQTLAPDIPDEAAVYLARVFDTSTKAKVGEDGELETKNSAYVICELYAAFAAPDAPAEVRLMIATNWGTILESGVVNPDMPKVFFWNDLTVYTELLIRFSPWKSVQHRLYWEDSLQEHFDRRNPARGNGGRALKAMHDYFVSLFPTDQESAVKDFMERMDEKYEGFYDPIGDQLLEGGE